MEITKELKTKKRRGNKINLNGKSPKKLKKTKRKQMSTTDWFFFTPLRNTLQIKYHNALAEKKRDALRPTHCEHVRRRTPLHTTPTTHPHQRQPNPGPRVLPDGPGQRYAPGGYPFMLNRIYIHQPPRQRPRSPSCKCGNTQGKNFKPAPIVIFKGGPLGSYCPS